MVGDDEGNASSIQVLSSVYSGITVIDVGGDGAAHTCIVGEGEGAIVRYSPSRSLSELVRGLTWGSWGACSERDGRDLLAFLREGVPSGDPLFLPRLAGTRFW